MAAAGIRVVQASSGAAAADAAPGSVLTRLRQQAAAQRVAKTLDLTVGGDFGEDLVIRYGMLPVAELEHYVDLVGRAGKVNNLALGIDMCVSSCQTILYRDQGTEVDLNVKIEGQLWQLLDWPLPEGVDSTDTLVPKEIMLALFGGNSVALAAHIGRVEMWMQDPGGSAPGEASAATS